jgi:hypothetical protein
MAAYNVCISSSSRNLYTNIYHLCSRINDKGKYIERGRGWTRFSHWASGAPVGPAHCVCALKLALPMASNGELCTAYALAERCSVAMHTLISAVNAWGVAALYELR